MKQNRFELPARPDFDKAIAKYEEARNRFNTINWADQAERLRDAIASIAQEQAAWESQIYLSQKRNKLKKPSEPPWRK